MVWAKPCCFQPEKNKKALTHFCISIQLWKSVPVAQQQALLFNFLFFQSGFVSICLVPSADFTFLIVPLAVSPPLEMMTYAVDFWLTNLETDLKQHPLKMANR